MRVIPSAFWRSTSRPLNPKELVVSVISYSGSLTVTVASGRFFQPSTESCS